MPTPAEERAPRRSGVQLGVPVYSVSTQPGAVVGGYPYRPVQGGAALGGSTNMIGSQVFTSGPTQRSVVAVGVTGGMTRALTAVSVVPRFGASQAPPAPQPPRGAAPRSGGTGGGGGIGRAAPQLAVQPRQAEAPVHYVSPTRGEASSPAAAAVRAARPSLLQRPAPPATCDPAARDAAPSRRPGGTAPGAAAAAPARAACDQPGRPGSTPPPRRLSSTAAPGTAAAVPVRVACDQPGRPGTTPPPRQPPGSIRGGGSSAALAAAATARAAVLRTPQPASQMQVPARTLRLRDGPAQWMSEMPADSDDDDGYYRDRHHDREGVIRRNPAVLVTAEDLGTVPPPRRPFEEHHQALEQLQQRMQQLRLDAGIMQEEREGLVSRLAELRHTGAAAASRRPPPPPPPRPGLVRLGRGNDIAPEEVRPAMPPQPQPGGPQRVPAVPRQRRVAELSQADKDFRIVEFMHRVSENGWDDWVEVDAIAATQFLEEARWDVGLALTHFTASLAEPEIAVYDAGMAEEARRLARLIHQLQSGQVDDAVDFLVNSPPEANAGESARDLYSRFRHLMEGFRQRSREQRDIGLEELRDQMLWLSQVEHQRAEADLEDALRLSTLEAYSGGFAVPPADEAMLAVTSSTEDFNAGHHADTRCAICLEDFADGDCLRVLKCSHGFHLHCVDTWLAQSGQCPTCKGRVG